MTYVLCNAIDCIHHDGEDCTLEMIDLNFSQLVDYNSTLNKLVYNYVVGCKEFTLEDKKDDNGR